jgi:hypothetical protein
LTDWIEADLPVAGVWFSADGSRIVTDRGMTWGLARLQGEIPARLPQLAEATAGLRWNETTGFEKLPATHLLNLQWAP